MILRSTLGVSLLILAVAATAFAASPSPSASPKPGPSGLKVPGYDPQVQKADKPLKILILGGTGFTGPFQVKYALARGHKVTVFNRGKTHPGELPEGVEQLIGDRTRAISRAQGPQVGCGDR